MVLMAGMELPVRAIREQIASALDIIVQLSRFSDGCRRVTAIVAVEGLEGDVILTQPLFNFRQKGVGMLGAVVGSYQACGQPPSFYEDLDEAGVRLDRSIFAAVPEHR
jgi:pilus assembly protein CpaF